MGGPGRRAARSAPEHDQRTLRALALLPANTKNLEQIIVKRPLLSETIFTFGHDSSLTTQIGWDNVTGYGEPRGLEFIAAAALEGLRVPLSSRTRVLAASSMSAALITTDCGMNTLRILIQYDDQLFHLQ